MSTMHMETEPETESSLKPEPPMIEVRGLVRRFGKLKAVDDVSFKVGRGEIVGFIGANGAGKTTTLRMLATLEHPDAGEIRIAGIDALDRPDLLRGKIGWMPDAVAIYPNMTILDYLDFFARACKLRGEKRVERLREVMTFTDLLGIADRDVRKLSKGMGQRLCLARTLLHDPDVLLLDEPAAGLDPKARIEFRHLIDFLAEQGKTILISSHILSELGEMCDSLLFIDNGRFVRHSTMESLAAGEVAGSAMEIGLADGRYEDLAEWIGRHGSTVVEGRESGGRLLIRLEAREANSAAGLLKELVLAGFAVSEFRKVEKRLEQVFVEMVKNEELKR